MSEGDIHTAPGHRHDISCDNGAPNPHYRFDLQAGGWTTSRVTQAASQVEAFDNVLVQHNKVDLTIGTALSGLGISDISRGGGEPTTWLRGSKDETGPSGTSVIRKQELSNRSTSSGVLSQRSLKCIKAIDEEQADRPNLADQLNYI